MENYLINIKNKGELLYKATRFLNMVNDKETLVIAKALINKKANIEKNLELYGKIRDWINF